MIPRFIVSEPVVAPQPPTPRRRLLLVVLSYGVRVPLGLFILWQMVFIFAYNTFAPTGEFRKWLADKQVEYDKALKNGDPIEGDLLTYQRVIENPHFGEHLEEWARKDSDSRIGRIIGKPHSIVTWWARKTGQEQGWGLFAPNTHETTCFISVELRWDDDLKALTSQSKNLAPLALTGIVAARIRDGFEDLPAPFLIPSLNRPKDIHRFVRFGEFRTRRTESCLETTLVRNGKPREACLDKWNEKVSGKVSDHRIYMLVFLRYKLRKFQEEHPDWPEPAQVILRTQTWTIPGPEVRPWDWIEESDEPLARWRPQRHPDPTPEDIEAYIHREGRFENWAARKWKL